MWGTAFGYDPVPRVIAALAGGILLGPCSSWAGGCTSGHGINGSIQLSFASMIMACCFFAGRIAIALLIFRVIRKTIFSGVYRLPGYRTFIRFK